MIKYLFILLPFCSLAQSYAPEPGVVGSTAIHKDSSIIVAWSNDVKITRGPLDIANPGLGDATFGVDADGEGMADNAPVSLGDGGEAVITFPAAMYNGPGPDFAIFENGFIDHYLELAFVEVSSDGMSFFRFDAITEIDSTVQLTNFDTVNCRYVHNFAGKYRFDWGTPFDLSELSGIPGLDINNITHIRLIDVVGSINPLWGTTDSQGHIINDPYPTAWESGGFDLDAVGAMYMYGAGIEEDNSAFLVYPNPVKDQLTVEMEGFENMILTDAYGRVILQSDSPQVDVSTLPSGVYHLNCHSNSVNFVETIYKL